jgi:hypothetical protein
MRKHPATLSPRQLAVPALVVGLMSPWRSRVLMAYLLMLGTRTLWLAASDPVAAPSFAAAIPVMHAGWAFGLWQGLVRRQAAP